MGSAVRKKNREFDPQAFLASIGDGRRIVSLTKKQAVFSQGDPADAVFYIQRGKIKLTVVSKTGREATLGFLTEGAFFGEGSLAGQPLRMGSAVAAADCTLLRIAKKSMMQAIHREHAFSDMFVAYLLARNVRYEEDLVDQLFNSSEKRLARILLLLAHFGKEGVPEVVIPKISQETLAEMVGTTRSRVSFFALAMATRQAYRPDPPDLTLFRNFIFSHCEGARYNRAFAFFTSVGREVEILFFHAGVGRNRCKLRVARNYARSTVKIDQLNSQP